MRKGECKIELKGVFLMMILLVGSIYDWKYLGLPIWLLLVGIIGGIGSVLYSLFWEDVVLFDVGMSFLPGIIALVLAFVTKEQLGYGDGCMLLTMGSFMGFQKTIMAVLIALCASFLVSVLLILLRKAGRKQKLPFVPLLFAGAMAVWGGGMLFGW